jgi:hypothetical protein
MKIQCLLDLISIPDVNQSIGTSCKGITLIISYNTRETGAFLITEYTFISLSILPVPYIIMFDTRSIDSVISCYSRNAAVKDGIRTSFILK